MKETYGDRDTGLVVEIFHLVGVARKERLLNEKRSMGFEKLGQLLSHRLVDTTMEITEKYIISLIPLGGDVFTYRPTSMPIDLISASR